MKQHLAQVFQSLLAPPVGLDIVDKLGLVLYRHRLRDLDLTEHEIRVATWLVGAGVEHKHAMDALDQRPTTLRLIPDVASHRSEGTLAAATLPAARALPTASAPPASPLTSGQMPAASAPPASSPTSAQAPAAPSPGTAARASPTELASPAHASSPDITHDIPNGQWEYCVHEIESRESSINLPCDTRAPIHGDADQRKKE